MWHGPFWIFLAISLLLAGLSLAIRKPRFIDIQLFIMIIAFAMSCDMLFCKQLELYNYVSVEYKGWYSFWANFIIVPSLGIVFIKFAPNNLKGISLYIILWAIAFTLFELYVAAPTGILHYPKWKVFPYSTVGYILSFIMEYLYYKLLIKHDKSN